MLWGIATTFTQTLYCDDPKELLSHSGRKSSSSKSETWPKDTQKKTFKSLPLWCSDRGRAKRLQCRKRDTPCTSDLVAATRVPKGCYTLTASVLISKVETSTSIYFTHGIKLILPEKREGAKWVAALKQSLFWVCYHCKSYRSFWVEIFILHHQFLAPYSCRHNRFSVPEFMCVSVFICVRMCGRSHVYQY